MPRRGPLSGESLVLMGVVAATGTTAIATTRQQVQKTQALARALTTEATAASLEAQRLHEIARTKQGPYVAQLEARAQHSWATADLATQRADELTIRRAPGLHFWWDILSDDDGPTIQRLQNVVWNLILGLVFVAGVYRTLSFPELGATLLTLLGISNGVYVGLKLREPNKAERQARAVPPGTGPVERQRAHASETRAPART